MKKGETWHNPDTGKEVEILELIKTHSSKYLVEYKLLNCGLMRRCTKAYFHTNYVKR